VLISYHRKNARKTNAISKEDAQLIAKIAKNHKVVFINFTSLYSTSTISFSNIETILIGYENSKIAQKTAAQILLGNQDVVGKLPASINKEFKSGFGIIVEKHHN